MRIKSLSLTNIGPFQKVDLNFIDPDIHSLLKPPAIVLTGMNGTGKSIIIDAIRVLLNGLYRGVGRDIIRDRNDFKISGEISIDYKNFALAETTGQFGNVGCYIQGLNLSSHIYHKLTFDPFWILDYWTSNIFEDSFKIGSLANLEPAEYLKESLTGQHKNHDVTKTICYFDYLRSSDDKKEKELGEYLMDKVIQIINSSLLVGKFSHVARTSLSVYIDKDGEKIELSKLSIGNIYLIQRYISILAKMYAVHILKETPINSICDIPGLLLIDEIENHFHPEWQKRILKLLFEIFPNLQVILTTHSPFIISSLNNCKIFVCHDIEGAGVSKVVDLTDYYANKPIEEILRTPLFDTDSFNIEISALLKERKNAIQANNKELAAEIEEKLVKINPEYFSVFNIDEMIEEIKG